MPRYFNKFPTINYSSARDIDSFVAYDQITDITVRIGVIQSALNNSAQYYEYLLRDGDTPEIVADKIYGDPEAHWLVLLANKVIDPQFDWMLDSRSFDNFIEKKYGSIEWAQTNWHHWEKVITRIDSGSGQQTVQKLWIDESEIVETDLPYDDYDTLPETEYNTYNLPDGTNCDEIITRSRVSFYDYENDLNESHRNIKIILPGYWGRIKEEFSAIMESSGGNSNSTRGLRFFS